ncbi:MAG: hypothetical protein WC887_00880 [Candidatus Paceibacterota bacterium]|jgi:hypothetical protein
MKFRILNLGIQMIVVVGVLFGYGFWYVGVAAKSVAVAELQNQIATKTETASRISIARAVIAGMIEDKAAVQGYFIPETGIVAFINELELQGQNQNTTVNVLSVSSDTLGTQPILLFSLAIKGSFDAVMRTVGTIEYMPYDLSISEFSLTQDEKNSWNANLSVRVGSVKTTPQTKSP